MYPYFTFQYLGEFLPKGMPLFGKGELKDQTTLFEWYSIRFWRFILVYRLHD